METAPVLSAPDRERVVTRDGDDFLFVDHRLTLELRFSRLRERGRGLTARVQVTDVTPIGDQTIGRVLAWQDVILSSAPSRKKFADALTYDYPPPTYEVEWPRFVNDAAYQVARALREDGSFVQVGAMDNQTTVDEYLVSPLVKRHDANMIYAPAGSAKGYLVTALGLHVEGVPILPWPIPTLPVQSLYCDWEWTPEEADKRVKAECAGAGHPAHVLTYRRMAGPLADTVDVLRPEIRRRQQQGHDVLMIVDSLQMAIGEQDGGDPSSGIIRLMNAVRSLNVTLLAVDHPRKGASDDDLSPYGSAYKGNLFRNVWKAKRLQSDHQELRLGLFLDPVSNVPPHAPVGLRLRFDRASWPAGPLRGLTFFSDDPRLVAGFSTMLNDTEKIEQALRDGALDVPTLTTRAGIKSQAITRARLNDHRGKKFVKLPEGKWANKAPSGLTP